MNIEELRQTIEQQTGVPASLLTGETMEENIAQARALLMYRRENESQAPKSAGQAFAEWFRTETGNGHQDASGDALTAIEEAARAEARAYPQIADGGELAAGHMPDARPAREIFAEWFSGKLAFNPFASGDGWRRMV